MSVQSASPGEPPVARWRLLGYRPPRCPFGSHRAGPSLDESARRLTHSELAAAEQLVSEGHRVRSLPERRGGGRVADLDVCGVPVEVKAWLPPAERSGRTPGPRSVFNKLVSARDQGVTAILVARGSGLSPVDAQRGVDLFAATGRFGGIGMVRVLGDGYDLAWGLGPGLSPPEPGGAPRPAPDPLRPGGGTAAVDRVVRPDLGAGMA